MKNHVSPNIVFILTDDQGWGDLSLTGNPNLHTPNIDRLAQGGALFEHFYVQPLCAPTRAEFLTGRYFPRTGVRGVTRSAEFLNHDEVTFGDVFQAAGYATGCFGKWHSGSAYPYHPNGRGFDQFYGYCCGHWSHYFDSTLEHNGEEFQASGYLTDCLTEYAMTFMEQQSATQGTDRRPFFCYVPLNTPHSPFQVPDAWYNKFKDKSIVPDPLHPGNENMEVTRTALAMCENIDWNVGRLVAKAEELGILEDTIFVYSTDNGPNGARWNGGMRGIKGSTDEGGVRSPFIIHWQGTIAREQRIPHIAGAIDLLPTLADLAGIDLDTIRASHAVKRQVSCTPVDGMNLRPLLMGGAETWPERNIMTLSANGKIAAVRTQRYRAGGHADGLFDMERDPGQQHNLSDIQPELWAQLQQRMAQWRNDVLPKGEPDNRLLPVGYTLFPITYLNAQDGHPSGGITWSSIHPNASYFIQWTNTVDTMHWDVEIRTAGMYRVTMMYACRYGDEGSEIEVSSENQRVRAFITEAFDAPIKDQDDRVRRVESYDKAFKPLMLGLIRLEQGPGKIVLRAVNKTGQEVAHVRSVKVEFVGQDV